MTNRARSTFESRAAWLKNHPELKGKPRTEIIQAMKRAGLVAPSTYIHDVRIYQRQGRDLPDDQIKKN